jgi:hypothetical protein
MSAIGQPYLVLKTSTGRRLINLDVLGREPRMRLRCSPVGPGEEHDVA